jgi:cytochrome c-type biogenesis protein CcmF
MAIYNATGNSLRASYLFVILSFAFVLYSTFLTRTGILGDTSVHSFTEAGMAMNILIGLFTIALPLPMLFLYIQNYKYLPAVHVEESTSSREFWMFIGSLIFFLSAMFIIAVTSVPVYNKMFNTNIADPQDREFTYNKVMVMVALIIGALTAVSQYFKYRQTGKKYFLPKIILPLAAATILIVVLAIFYPVNYLKQGQGFLIAMYLALFACFFSVIANSAYLWVVLKGNLKAGGAAISHVGFTLMIAAMLISSGNRQVISDNRKTGINIPFDVDPAGKQTQDPLENLTLLREVPTEMANYTLTYVNDSAAFEKNRTFYTLLVEKKDNGSGKILENFALRPDVYKMKDNNLSSNPDIKHYLFHDVFTYISSVPDKSSFSDTAQFKVHEMKLKDSVFYSKGFLVLNDILKNPDNERFHFTPTDTALVADITVFTNEGTSYKAYPLLAIKNYEVTYRDDTVFAKNLFLKLVGLSDRGKFKIAVKESGLPSDFVTLKAYVFPYINFVWLGLIIMASGIILSLLKRVKAKPVIAALVLLAISAGLFYMFLFAN